MAINYRRGEAYREAVATREKLDDANSSATYAKLLANIRGADVATDDVHLMRMWECLLIKKGMELDVCLDKLTSRLVDLGDSWRDSKKPVLAIFYTLLDGKAGLRDFEAEIEDYILYVTTHPGIREEMVGPPTQMLTEVQATFSKTYDLCIFKLHSINSGRVTATNIALSVLALIVATLSLIIAISNPFNPKTNPMIQVGSDKQSMSHSLRIHQTKKGQR